MVRDIYNIERSYMRSIKKSKQFMEYIEYLLSQGISKNRIIKILSFLRQSHELADRNLKGIKEQELIRLLAKIQALEISGATRNDYIIILRGYLKFLYRHQKRKYEQFRELLQKRKCSDFRIPKFIIEKPQLQAILNATDNEVVQDICAILLESAARIGELLNLQDTDIEEYPPYGVIAHLDGKTGKREVLIIENADRLRKRVRLSAGGYLFNQNHASFARHLEKIRIKLGWPELYAHQFRKSRGTYLFERTTDQVVLKILGHTPDSRARKSYSFVRKEVTHSEIIRIHNESYPSRLQDPPDFMDNKVIHPDLTSKFPGRITYPYLNGQLSPFLFHVFEACPRCRENKAFQFE